MGADEAAELEESRMRETVLLELMRGPKAEGLARLSTRRKVRLGESLRRDFGYFQRQVSTFFAMSRSTYANGLRVMSRDAVRAAEVVANVRRAFEESGWDYGYRCVRAVMARWGEPFAASEREVKRVMREGCGAQAHAAPREVKLLLRRARRAACQPALAPRRHARLLGGLTRQASRHRRHRVRRRGGACLSPVINCFDGLSAAWSASIRSDSALCESSLWRYLGGAVAGGAAIVRRRGRGPAPKAAPHARCCTRNAVPTTRGRRVSSAR